MPREGRRPVAAFPFGEAWVQEHPSLPIAFQFTGKELDASGLYYFGARYYDPRTSVWQSGDPILGKYLPSGDKEPDSNLPGMGGIYNDKNLATYGYVGQRPISFSDPDGKEIVCTAAGTCTFTPPPSSAGLPTVLFPGRGQMPARISDDSWWHHYYRVDVPAGNADIERLRTETGKSATGIPDTVSTEAGTLIDVNQNGAILPFGRDDVMSYKINLPNGDVVFLNVTEPNHTAHPGVVMQVVARDNEGNISIITVGEGSSMIQRIFDPSNTQAIELWKENSRNIIERASEEDEVDEE